MSVTFEKAMELTLGHEGGWYDGSDPRDPNPTMFGVTQQTYDAYRSRLEIMSQSVRFIDKMELHNIYRQYWVGVCDEVANKFPLTALCLFDMSINAGPVVAKKLLQAALDLVEDGDVGDLDHDGKIGPVTRAVLARLSPTLDELLCVWLLMERVRFYDNLAKNQRLRPNLKAWLGRTVHFYDQYIRGR